MENFYKKCKAPLGTLTIYKGKQLTRVSKRKACEVSKTYKTPKTLKSKTHTKCSTFKNVSLAFPKP
jgi:hypothetical protein